MPARWRPTLSFRPDRGSLVVLAGATVAYAALACAIALSNAASQRADARQGSIDEVRRELAVLAAFAPRLVTRDGSPLAERERRHVDQSWGRLASAHGSRRSLRIWRADGSLLYQSPGDREHRHAAPSTAILLREGWAATHDDERLHVFMPLLADGRVAGIAELAQPIEPLLADEAAQGRRQLWRFAAGSLLLWLVLMPVWLRVSRLVAAAWDPGQRLLVRRLRRGMSAGELELHYQPKVDVASGELEGLEALVRWRRDGHLIAPASFMPAVERSAPLIRDVTLFVLDTALADAREWERAGLVLTVAVNVAPVSLGDTRLAGDVADGLRRHDMPPERLIIEVTETAVLDERGDAAVMLEQLAGVGVRLSVDDFGTGHSSLSRVTRHPFTELKIDRSFVMELVGQRRPVVATMVHLAHALRLRVVAEGVQDDATLNALRGIGCDLAQGYHLGRPMPAQDVVGFARALPEATRAASDVRSLLNDVRESLDLDAAFIAEFAGDQQIFRATSGASEAFALREGGTQALHHSYCARVVEGVFPNLIPDARHDPGARALAVTGLSGIGAYIGVPLHCADGSFYGTLCGLSRTPRTDLADDDVSMLEEFAQRFTPLLDAAHLAVSADQS